jgi:hypothetical protein
VDAEPRGLEAACERGIIVTESAEDHKANKNKPLNEQPRARMPKKAQAVKIKTCEFV